MTFEPLWQASPARVAESLPEELRDLVSAFRELVLGELAEWCDHPPLVDCAVAGLSGVRALEYGFVARHLADLEAGGRRLRMLDVGCGVALLPGWLTRRGHEVWALDPRLGDLALMLRHKIDVLYGSGVRYVAGQGEQLPFATASFDVVTCLSALVHMLPGNDRVALSEMARILRPGGRLYLTLEVVPPPWRGRHAPARLIQRRRLGQPYTPDAVADLLRGGGGGLTVSPADLPTELGRLRWKDVYAFRRSIQRHELGAGSAEPGLVLGAALARNSARVALRGTDVAESLLEGQAALAQRMELCEWCSEPVRHRPGRARRAVRRQTRRVLVPRLGFLRHYPPRFLHVPAWYREPLPLAAWPVITVVTPTFNSARFVERTVRSVVEQGYESLEYIIQDGSSADETLEILAPHRDWIAIIHSEKDRGQTDALNRGFRRATGEILAYLNSDDLLLPGTLRYVAWYFSTHPDVDVIYGHRVLIDERDAEIGRWVLPPHRDWVLSWADFIPQETMYWRRSIWDKVGARFDERFRFAMDWELILRFRAAGARFARVPRFLGAFRVHSDQKSTAQLNTVGAEEMARLHERVHGRRFTQEEVRRRLRPYFLEHIVCQKLYRLGILRY